MNITFHCEWNMCFDRTAKAMENKNKEQVSDRVQNTTIDVLCYRCSPNAKSSKWLISYSRCFLLLLLLFFLLHFILKRKTIETYLVHSIFNLNFYLPVFISLQKRNEKKKKIVLHRFGPTYRIWEDSTTIFFFFIFTLPCRPIAVLVYTFFCCCFASFLSRLFYSIGSISRCSRFSFTKSVKVNINFFFLISFL